MLIFMKGEYLYIDTIFIMEKISTNYYAKIMFKVLIILFIALGIFIAYKVAAFYIPFIIAILISSMIEPLIKIFTQKLKFKRKTASIISLIIFTIIIGAILTILITSIITESKALLEELNGPAYNIYNWSVDMINDIKDGNVVIPENILNTIQNSFEWLLGNVKDIIYNTLTGLINFASSIPTTITYGIITILAIVFICIDREYVFKLIKKHIPKKWVEKSKDIINKTCSITWNYIKAEAKLSGICFILVLIGLTVFNICGLDVKYTVLMAIFIGFIDLLPLFGAGAVMIPWAVYLYFLGNHSLAIAILILWIIWAILKQIIEPKFVSKQMGMHPIFTLIGMYTGFKFIGVIGLMVGPIVLLILKNVFNDLFERGILKTFFELE